MPEEFEGDLAESVFWGADLSRSEFRDVNLTGVRISHALLVDVDIDAQIDRFVINGVDVTAFVNERDQWYPLRAMIRPTDGDGARAAWTALEDTWGATIARARALPEASMHQSVNGEFTFVETLRHVVFAIDKWFTAPILGEALSPFGMPNRGSVDFPFPGLDSSLTPSLDDALAVLSDRAAKVRDFVSTVEATDFDREIDVLENGPHPLREGLYTVFEEAFWHNRYALRDLAVLEASD